MCSKSLDCMYPILEKYKGKPGGLIPALHEIQEELGFLSQEVQGIVADELGLARARVNGVVTFYSFFNEQPKGQYEVGVCLGTACYVRGAAKVVEELERQLGIEMGGTTEDGVFSLGATRCIGACGLAPIVSVNDEIFGRCTPEKAREIVETYKEKAMQANNA